MNVTIVIVVGLAVFSVLIGALILGNLYEKKRTERFGEIARELGLEFFPEGDPGFVSRFSGLRLFSQGRRRKFTNMLVGRTQDVDIAVFGYRYTTGSGKHAHTFRQTVISFQSSSLSLPKFELRPEQFFHKIGQAFGYQDIDFDTHPVFSKRYLLRGYDVSVRDVFTPELLELFESRQQVSTEAVADCLVYYRSGNRIKPDQVRAFMNEGFQVYQLLKTEHADTDSIQT